MSSHIKTLVIAGGGTAGWITAALLSKQFNTLMNIILVESDKIGTVGVGEATIPTHKGFHQLLKIDESEFMKATNATFKLGISFEGWTSENSEYFHAFGQVGRGTWMGHFHHLWLQAKANGYGGDLDDYCLELRAAKAGKFQIQQNNISVNYAYHLDSGKYAKFLRQLSEDAGVQRIEGLISTVNKDNESGQIKSLSLESGETIEGDFFIDCTGFKSLLLGEALDVGFEDWGDYLPTNRACVAQTTITEAPIPYTKAIAHEAGWRWRIPLQSRIGNGLVYSSEYMSDQTAETLLRRNIKGELLTTPRIIKFKTGKRQKLWSKNCVAIGLSSGFLEPLESTSIHLIQTMVTRLAQLFPFNGNYEALSQRFNSQVDTELTDIRDFLILHYHLNNRHGEAFWDYHRNIEIPDSLAHRISLFEQSGVVYQDGEDLFRSDSWIQVMMGQGIMPQHHHGYARVMPADKLEMALVNLKQNIDTIVNAMPTHEAFIQHYCATKMDE